MKYNRYTHVNPCIRSLAKFPTSQAKAGQARLSGFLARLTGKMRPGKARQAWPQSSFLGNLGHQSLAFVALFVLRPGFLGNLGQKRLGLPGLQDLSQAWPGFCGIPGQIGITTLQHLKPGIFPCKIGTGISPGSRRGDPFSRRDPSGEKFPPRISARIPPRNLYLPGSRQEKKKTLLQDPGENPAGKQNLDSIRGENFLAE